MQTFQKKRTITLELKLGKSVGKDTLVNVNESYNYSNGTEYYTIKTEVEIDQLIELGVRVEYQFGNHFYTFFVPSYANLEISAIADFDYRFVYDDGEVYSFGDSGRESDDEWEFGLGLGLGYQFTDVISAELHYQQFDEADVVGASFKYAF